MKKETIKLFSEIRNDIRECLKGYKEGVDYKLESFVETEDYSDHRLLTTNVRLCSELTQAWDKDTIRRTLSSFQGYKGDGFSDNCEDDCFTISDRISEADYQFVIIIENLNETIEREEQSIEDNSGNFRSDTIYSESSESDTAFDESKTDEEDRVEVILNDEPYKPERIHKSFGGCVKDTFRDQDAQKNAIGLTAMVAILTGSILVIKEFCTTPRQEGESRFRKTMRVFPATFKKPKTWLTIGGTSLLAYGLSIGGQACNRMR